MGSSDDSSRLDPRLTHPDAETLALLALHETVSTTVSAHVEGCDECRIEVQSLRRLVDVGRSLGADDLEPIRPPARVWDRIAAETGVQASPSTSAAASAAADSGAAASGPAALGAAASGPADSESAASGPAPEPSGSRDADNGRPAGSRSRESGSKRRGSWILAAAVAGALVGGAATWGWQARDDKEPTVVASASLQPLPSKSGTGTAEVERVNNNRELAVRVDATQPGDDFLEVWLISNDTKRLVSLGVLQDHSGLFPVPAGIDLADYSIVDVSIEPYDGDPAHSHNSLVRGTLQSS